MDDDWEEWERWHYCPEDPLERLAREHSMLRNEAALQQKNLIPAVEDLPTVAEGLGREVADMSEDVANLGEEVHL